MFLTTHTVVGVLISQHTPSPLIAFSLGFLSHFLLDFIPHGDEQLLTVEDKEQGKFRKAALASSLDVALTVAFFLFLYSTVDLHDLGQVSAGIVGSILPDVLDNFLPVFHRAFRWFFVIRFLHWLQRKVHLSSIVQQQTRIHGYFHKYFEHFFDFRISQLYGIAIQILLLLLFLVTFDYRI